MGKQGKTAAASGKRSAPARPLQMSLLEVLDPEAEAGMMDEREFRERLEKALGEPLEVILTRNRSSLITVKVKPDGSRQARIQRAFLKSDRDTIKALAQFIRRPTPKSRRVIDRFLHSHSELVEELGRGPASPGMLIAKGVYRDLGKVLKKVNREYGFKVKGLKIAWSRPGRERRRRRSIKFGSYCSDTRTIRVHPDLDDPRVPDFFVEYIVYHEILHAIFPPVKGTEGSARQVHGREFKRYERKFERFEEALEFERTFVKKWLG